MKQICSPLHSNFTKLGNLKMTASSSLVIFSWTSVKPGLGQLTVNYRLDYRINFSLKSGLLFCTHMFHECYLADKT